MLELNRIYNMDCLEGMKLLDDNSIDSIVTDPPYELGFMGLKWDNMGIAYNIELWKECLRILKPGGHLLAFGGTRTYHRMACAIEDAGFEIRDQIMWIYGSGFPKSHDISKAIDKMAGAEREVIGEYRVTGNALTPTSVKGGTYVTGAPSSGAGYLKITAPATPEAKQWDGWGTALKPANEPIVLARKPLSEKTVAENVLKWGTGGLNIDGCRLNTLPRKTGTKPTNDKPTGTGNTLVGSSKNRQAKYDMLNKGRFPANVILDEEAGKMLDEQSGILKSGGGNKANKKPPARKSQVIPTKDTGEIWEPNSGGASRFFYCAKASKKERGEGNNHPTVKPIKLMEYLITLITPPNGIVLDPFIGSGTTAIAALNTGRFFIGIEKEEKYVEIARKRIAEHMQQLSIV